MEGSRIALPIGKQEVPVAGEVRSHRSEEGHRSRCQANAMPSTDDEWRGRWRRDLGPPGAAYGPIARALGSKPTEDLT